MTHPFLEQLLGGSGTLWLALIVLAAAVLVVRRISSDRAVRRRALWVIVLLAAFATLLIVLGQIPERTSGFVRTPGGELVPGLVENSAYRYTAVALLLLGLLAALTWLSLVFVDFLLVDRLDFEVPNILRDVAIAALFFTGALVILNARTGMEPLELITTAGAISIVVGLALQDTLGNVFSGLALQTERSFNVGDWVRFNDFEGVVTDISWRATKIRTRDNDFVIVPNSVISKDVVVNYSAPTRVHALHATVGAHYRHPPADVFAAIEEAARQTEGVLPSPAVDVRTEE
ncbi:MAG: mechanosensitive ion channel, partial [Gemmatimonadota bacterium]|nr:mechanosensitive ion channel [Gemmatimonadota bacterium]